MRAVTDDFLTGLSNDITRFLRRDDIVRLGVDRIALADIRDRLDRLVGRPPWQPGEPPRPPVDQQPVDADDAESTWAALRRAEQERDELAAQMEMLPCRHCWGMGLIPAEASGRDADGAPWTEEERPCPEGCEIPGWLDAERNDAADDARLLGLARAELASARQELDAVRTARDNLDRELAEARATIRAFMEAPDDTDD